MAVPPFLNTAFSFKMPCEAPYLRCANPCAPGGQLGWRGSAPPAPGHPGGHTRKGSPWDVLAGHLSSGHSSLCIALDRRCYFQKGVSGGFFPFMLKHQCLGSVRKSVQVVTSFPAPGRSRVGCAGGWVSKSVLLPLKHQILCVAQCGKQLILFNDIINAS